MSDIKQHVVIGMAGHIDHGKTAIIQQLTGTNTDRLKEEVERGITTDLGFAFLGKDITIIDVPGHERFVKTMVAGVNTVDMAVLVIAADDGIMPQTQEHLDILNLLQVKRGIVVLNKIDKVDEEWLELVEEEIQETIAGTVLDSAPIVRTSALENIGIDTLKEQILTMAKSVPPRVDAGFFRLFVDRVFTIKGFGTIVAGTVLSGDLRVNETVDLLPDGRSLRVRGLQVHNKSAEKTEIGYRAAINLMNVDKDEISRGDVLAEPGYCHGTYMFDAHFSVLASWKRELKNRERVRVNIGTAEAIARIVILDEDEYQPGKGGFVQVHCERPIVAQRGDRFVVRSYSPVFTLGGGVVLDSAPMKHKRKSAEMLIKLKKMHEGDPSQSIIEYLNRKFFMPENGKDIAQRLSFAEAACNEYLEMLVSSGDVIKIGKKRFISTENLELLKRRIVAVSKEYFVEKPYKGSISKAELKSGLKRDCDPNLFNYVLELFATDGAAATVGDKVTFAEHTAVLDEELQAAKDTLLKSYVASGFEPPLLKEMVKTLGKKSDIALELLQESGEIIILDEKVTLASSLLHSAMKSMVETLKKQENCTIQEFREVMPNASRKVVFAILEYADRIGLTMRKGEGRILKNPDAYEVLKSN